MFGKVFSITIIIILVGLLYSVVQLTGDIYSEMLSVRLNPVNNQHFYQKNKELTSLDKNKDARIILFGDSRIAMWQDQFKFAGYQVINRGIGGETSAQALYRLESDVIALNADLVIIQIGINDLKAITFFSDSEDEIIQNTKKNITTMVTDLQRNKVNVYLMTILPASKPTGFWWFFWTQKIDNAVSKVNEYIRSMQGSGVVVVDCDPEFSYENKLKQDYGLDTLHMNNVGYETLSILVRNQIQQHQDSHNGKP